MDLKKEDKIKKKCKKQFPDFVEAVDSYELNKLEANLLSYAKHRQEVMLFRDNDEALNEAKKVKSELEAPYNETLRAIELKSAYLNLLLEEQLAKGQPVNEEQEAQI